MYLIFSYKASFIPLPLSISTSLCEGLEKIKLQFLLRVEFIPPSSYGPAAISLPILLVLTENFLAFDKNVAIVDSYLFATMIVQNNATKQTLKQHNKTPEIP